MPTAPGPNNASQLCDRASDIAPMVPLTNRRMAVLVSKRVGNVQHSPAWLTLLDQMWVR